MTEMSSYPMSSTKTITTLWELMEQAAKEKYGDDVKVRQYSATSKALNELDFDISIVDADIEPKETKRTIVDINMKEYTNRCQKEVDETIVKVSKTSSKSTEDRYQFSSTEGVSWGIGGNIGAQVMGVAMAGGSVGIGGQYGKQKSETTETSQTKFSNFQFSYEQQEKILVPPMSQVKAKITSYSMKYEQTYTLRFTASSSTTIPVSYKTRCQQTCFGINIGHITITELLHTLPYFREEEEEGTVSYVQRGTLSWIGEGSSIDKFVEPILV